MKFNYQQFLFAIDEQKINEIGDFVSKIINKYFSNVAGGVILMLLIIIVVFSMISSSSRRNR